MGSLDAWVESTPVEHLRFMHSMGCISAKHKFIDWASGDLSKGREYIADHLNNLGLTNVAVEVGTDRGVYASQFMARWNGRKLMCVDPFIEYGGKMSLSGQAEFEVSAEAGRDRLEDLRIWQQATFEWSDRIELLRMTSAAALRRFEVESVDMAYIDADHRRQCVYRDVFGWWEKVKRGGILAGHDLNGCWEMEVRPVVQLLAHLTGARITAVRGDEASWLIQKP